MARFELVLPNEHKEALQRLAERKECSMGLRVRKMIEDTAIREGCWPRAVDKSQPAPSVRSSRSSVTS